MSPALPCPWREAFTQCQKWLLYPLGIEDFLRSMYSFYNFVSPGTTEMFDKSQKSSLLLRECQHTGTAERVEDTCEIFSEPFFIISGEAMQTSPP